MLTSLIKVCAAPVSLETQTALVDVESGKHSWALHDDNSGIVYHPRTLAEAKRTVVRLLENRRARYGASDRGVDIGLGQINSLNLGLLRTDAFAMLDPCRNLRASSSLLADAYARERAHANGRGQGSDQTALARALQIYNSGRASGDQRYVDAIYAAASRRARPTAATAKQGRETPAIAAIAPAAPAVFIHVDRSARQPIRRPLVAHAKHNSVQAHGSAFIETPVASLVRER